MSISKDAEVNQKTSEELSSSGKDAEAGAGQVLVARDAAVEAFYSDAISEAYRVKSELVAKHLSDIGMGKFQWILFVVAGFGWIVDNFWSQGISAVRPAVANEFTDVTRLSFSSVAYYVGMIIGASFWGTGADLIGRKPAFNATILYGGIFACAVAGTKNFVAFCSLWAVIGTAAGGNVPVDSIIFLEFMPPEKQWLLVSLSAWWNFGQVIVALLSWVFLSNYACTSADAPCAMDSNMGWRYLMITLGLMAIAFGLIRILAFKIPESPRYLLSKGRDADAVEAVNYIARYNGKPETLTIDMLRAIDAQLGHGGSPDHPNTSSSSKGLSQMQILKESFKDYDTGSFKKLFSGRRLARHTSVTFIIWLTIGIAYPLYFAFITSYLQTKSTYSVDSSLSHTYMIYCIVSAVGVLGPVAAGFSVETRLGRRWMMAISAILTGVFLYLYTLAKSEIADVAFQCVTGILGNFEYAIMFAFTPESFPGPIRGTGTGIAATLLRFGGLFASFISTYSGYTSVPIYVSAALWIVTGFICFALPYETHGHASI
ncbi:MFS general substrate transporter [Byssothecium circinans]|uniref:MFS general substrate transporter n=1 Tax=Byssothecium circinans TaxID=147558 RepID=A0A6A5T9A8_9PLEO|nr:MFS general substrate transporter [Byssothecium circinans]